MSNNNFLIKKKFIGSDQVDGDKILLSNEEALRAKKKLGGNLDILEVNADDKVDFLGNLLKNISSPVDPQDAATKATLTPRKVAPKRLNQAFLAPFRPSSREQWLPRRLSPLQLISSKATLILPRSIL